MCAQAPDLTPTELVLQELVAELDLDPEGEKAANLREHLRALYLQQEQLHQEQELRNLLILALVIGCGLGATLLLLYRNKLVANRGLTELNQRLGHQQEQLRAANEDLARLNREMNEVLAVVSHDLKNPLVGIEGLSHELRTMALDAGDAQQAHMLAMIESSAHRMFILVTDLLDLQRLEVGHHGLEARPVDLRHITNAAISDLELVAQEKFQRLSVEGPDQVWALGDEAALLRVASNLLSNAVKYSPQRTEIRIQLKASPRPSLEVTDQGPGIPPHESVKLFRKFSRLSTRPTGGESSTGLGLAISKGIMDALNGRIWCQSTVGKGATFGIELPPAKAPDASAKAKAAH